jgi:hypothetical protein
MLERSYLASTSEPDSHRLNQSIRQPVSLHDSASTYCHAVDPAKTVGLDLDTELSLTNDYTARLKRIRCKRVRRAEHTQLHGSKPV